VVDSRDVSQFPPPPPGAERRLHVRKDLLAQIQLNHGDEVVITMVNNLSLGGAFLLHEGGGLATGELVEVTLSHDEVEVVQRARVVRVNGSGVAVAWIEPRARTYAIIERLMKSP